MGARAVLWDVDGTFVDSERIHARALQDVLDRRDVRLSRDLQGRLVGVSMDEVHAMLLAEHPELPDTATLLEAKLRAFLARADELTLRPGVVEAQRLLDDLGVARAWVSNADRLIVDANLRAVGVFELGLVTVSRNDVRSGKPHAEPYLRAAHLIGVTPSQCIVVEDSPVGAEAGLAAGMTVIVWAEPTHLGAPFPAGVVRAAPDDLVSTLAAFFD